MYYSYIKEALMFYMKFLFYIVLNFTSNLRLFVVVGLLRRNPCVYFISTVPVLHLVSLDPVLTFNKKLCDRPYAYTNCELKIIE